MNESRSTHCDPRVRAVEKLIVALAEVERECGDFGEIPVISCDYLASVLMMLGGKMDMGERGFPIVKIERGGTELIAEVSSAPIGGK